MGPVLDLLPLDSKKLVFAAVLPHLAQLSATVLQAFVAYCTTISKDHAMAHLASCVLAMQPREVVGGTLSFPSAILDEPDADSTESSFDGSSDEGPPRKRQVRELSNEVQGVEGVHTPGDAPCGQADTSAHDDNVLSADSLVAAATALCRAACSCDTDTDADHTAEADVAIQHMSRHEGAPIPLTWPTADCLPKDKVNALAAPLTDILMQAMQVGALPPVCTTISLHAAPEELLSTVLRAVVHTGVSRANLTALLRQTLLQQVSLAAVLTSAWLCVASS